jgi:protein subunit release factor B
VSAQQVTRHLLERSQVRYSRASGPGGQHRDHTESRAELVIGRDALDGLPDDVAARLLDRLHLTKRPLRLASQNDRSRERNRATVERAPQPGRGGASSTHDAQGHPAERVVRRPSIGSKGCAVTYQEPSPTARGGLNRGCG